MRLHVSLEMPPWVLQGLAAGILERVGGVVRDRQTKQVVMWLRDTGCTPAQTLMGLAIPPSWLHLGIAAASFLVIAQTLDQIAGELEQLRQSLQAVAQKIDLSFYANFRAAVDLAQNTFQMRQESNRRSSAMAAINRFLEAQHVYRGLVQQHLAAGTPAIGGYLHTLQLAYLMEARCYLELEELETAEQRLAAAYQETHQLLQRYVGILLTDRPIIYLHPKLSPQVDLARLTRLWRWYRENLHLTENDVFEQLRRTWLLTENDDLHVGYWIDRLPGAILPQSAIERNLFGVTRAGRDRVFAALVEAVARMESLMETDQRFCGYRLEVEALRQVGIPFADFQALRPEGPSLPSVVYIYPDS